MICVVHYKNQVKYSGIKKVSVTNRNRILEAKAKRIAIGGDNLHQEQIETIPEEFDFDHHGIHLEPCYKK